MLSDAVAPAVLAVIETGAEAVLIAGDNAQNALILDQFFEAGFEPLVCSDFGAAGAGGPNTVGLANPEAADGFLAALQTALPDTPDPLHRCVEGAGGRLHRPRRRGAANFSLQNYSTTRVFIELMDRLDGNYSYENFHAVAETLGDDPISVPTLPPTSCGPLPGGHSCGKGAGVAVYNAFENPNEDGIGTWVQVRASRDRSGSKRNPLLTDC